MVSSPHGPETGDDHAHLPKDFPAAGSSKSEETRIFNSILYPNDLYTPEGVYWADLPFRQQMKFNTAVDNAETKKELSTIWSMIKEDPLSPISWYFKNAVLPGAGLGLEGYVYPQLDFPAANILERYVLFSIGNLTPLFSAVWPQCWKTYKVCNKQWTFAVTYLEIVGIIIGQILVGIIGDSYGARS